MGQIGAMALGYKSAKCVQANGAEQFSLSDKAVGRTVEKLRKRKLFVKASPDNGRTTYYSNSMSQEQMMRYVAEVKLSRIEKRKGVLTMAEMQKQVNARAKFLAAMSPEQRAQIKEKMKLADHYRRKSEHG